MSNFMVFMSGFAFIAGLFLGWASSRSNIADNCAALHGFVIDETVYDCTVSRQLEETDQ